MARVRRQNVAAWARSLLGVEEDGDFALVLDWDGNVMGPVVVEVTCRDRKASAIADGVLDSDCRFESGRLLYEFLHEYGWTGEVPVHPLALACS
jgi:hypothetical protein